MSIHLECPIIISDIPHPPSPEFSQRIQVDQTAEGAAIMGFLATGMLGGVPGFVVSILSHSDATGWWGFVSLFGILGGGVLSIIGMLAGMVAWFPLEQRWLAWRGKLPFSAVTRVVMDETGLQIEGLGCSPWDEVMSWESIPDSNSALIIHTQRYGGLLLRAPIDTLIPLVAHHLNLSREAALQNPADAPFRFRAQVFSWPRFILWIIAGYAAGIGAAAALILAGPIYDPFKMLVGLIMLPVMCAWLIWTIPFWRLSLFSDRHIRAFELKGAVLQMGDGSWVADLTTSQVQNRQTWGIGYNLTFITLRPHQGKRLDLLLDTPEHAALVTRLIALELLTPAPVKPPSEWERPDIDIRRWR